MNIAIIAGLINQSMIVGYARPLSLPSDTTTPLLESLDMTFPIWQDSGASVTIETLSSE